jgi:hypothetical protein
VQVEVAQAGIVHIWSDHGAKQIKSALPAHQILILANSHVRE